MVRNRVVNAIGFLMTGTVLIIVLISKFMAGAWIVCLAMPLLYLLMKAIRRHYDRVALELAPDDDSKSALPSRVHAIVRVEGSQADAAGPRVCESHPARHAGSIDGQCRSARYQGIDGGLGTPRPAGVLEDPRLTVPGDHPARAGICARPASKQPGIW